MTVIPISSFKTYEDTSFPCRGWATKENRFPLWGEHLLDVRCCSSSFQRSSFSVFGGCRPQALLLDFLWLHFVQFVGAPFSKIIIHVFMACPWECMGNYPGVVLSNSAYCGRAFQSYLAMCASFNINTVSCKGNGITWHTGSLRAVYISMW